MLHFERLQQSPELGFAFAGKDQRFCGEPILQGVQSDGGASFRRFRTGAFLRVAPVGFNLSFSRHLLVSRFQSSGQVLMKLPFGEGEGNK